MSGGFSISVSGHVSGQTGGLDYAYDLETGPGLTAVFGPSGAGKTTLLNVVSGLLHPSQGYVRVGGETLCGEGERVPVERRGAGYIFQDGRLFPHLTVARNLIYGRHPGREPPLSLEEVVGFLGIGHLLDRRPSTLSGGEAQRVAIGRALLSAPRFLLMDEPLSKLDGERKAGIAAVIAALRDRVDLPILYVTHDRREVEDLADHIVLLNEGRVRAYGPAAVVLADLDLPFAVDPDAASVIAARVTAYDADYDLTEVAAGGQKLWLPGERGRAGDPVRVLIRAGDVTLYREPPDGGSALNSLICRIAGVRFERNTAVVRLALAEGQGVFIAHVTRRSFDRLGLAAGDTVHALVKATSSRRHAWR